MAEPDKKAPVKGVFSKDINYSDEQQRLRDQVEIIQRDIDIEPFGQAFKKNYSAVDAYTGEEIPYGKIDSHKGDFVCDEKGHRLSPEEHIMLSQGWGRVVEGKGRDGAWRVNANVGIRTHGDDALDIVLVEKGGPATPEKAGLHNDNWTEVEPRTWEYHISRKGADRTDPSNVLVVPVFSAFQGGVLADIGNKGSSYSSENVTLKGFQPQKVLRHADDIEINLQEPISKGSMLVVLERDPFEAFAEKKAYTGGTIVVPEHLVEKVRKGSRTITMGLRGGGDNWGEVACAGSFIEEGKGAFNAAVSNNIYAEPALPQDETTFISKKTMKAIDGLRFPPKDAYSVVPEGAHVMLKGNTGNGPEMTVNENAITVPPHAGSSQAPVEMAWHAAPVWLHGPGNKGTIDLTGLDGRVVISGGGTIKTSQNPINTWWFADVTLTGGTKDNKAVYTVEIPEFEDEKLKLDVTGREGGKRFRVERYPMPPYQQIPLTYPDGEEVPLTRSENDVISIKGDNIEVWVKEGEKTRKLYDSEQPELNHQSGIMQPDGVKLGAGAVIALAGNEAMSNRHTSRRDFLKVAGAGAFAALFSRQQDEKPEKVLSVQQSAISGVDAVSASVEELMPDIKLTHGRSIVTVGGHQQGVYAVGRG